MRTLIVLATLLTPATAEARLFWQTYGATVTIDADCGAGCAWNLNQDYFVPRHCDSCRYDLFSACKTAHTRSPACKNLHPIYCGYCTPYGSCRYKWRDHVYKTYCGCTPLRHEYGPWHLEKCKKHALGLRHPEPGCTVACGLGDAIPSSEIFVETPHDYAISFCNVEPFGGETLGTVAAIASGSVGGGAGVAATPMAPAPQLPPKLNLTPTSTGAGGGLPAPFNY